MEWLPGEVACITAAGWIAQDIQPFTLVRRQSSEITAVGAAARSIPYSMSEIQLGTATNSKGWSKQKAWFDCWCWYYW